MEKLNYFKWHRQRPRANKQGWIQV